MCAVDVHTHVQRLGLSVRSCDTTHCSAIQRLPHILGIVRRRVCLGPVCSAEGCLSPTQPTHSCKRKRDFTSAVRKLRSTFGGQAFLGGLRYRTLLPLRRWVELTENDGQPGIPYVENAVPAPDTRASGLQQNLLEIISKQTAACQGLKQNIVTMLPQQLRSAKRRSDSATVFKQPPKSYHD